MYHDEAISGELYALAHIKDIRLKTDSIAAVHASMIKWGSTPQKAGIAMDQFGRHPIAKHSVMFMRETNPIYNPHEECIVEAGQVSLPIKKQDAVSAWKL